VPTAVDSGDFHEKAVYDAYGTMITSTGSTPNNYLYAEPQIYEADNAFSKKLENHRHSLALHFMH
jgi:hypothetical protein